jgi:nucleoside-diphosphate-sugar epimerase
VSKVFLAGSTGAIGKRLMPQLIDGGYEVFGTTRSEKKAPELQTAGVTPKQFANFSMAFR